VPPVVNQHHLTTRAKLGHRMPALYHTVSLSPIPKSLSPIPKSYRVALADPNWRAAMEEKVVALSQNKTWDLVPRPLGTNVVSGKWVFKIKYNPDGSFQRYKARWVVCGYSQHPRVDSIRLSSPRLFALCCPLQSLAGGLFISSMSKMLSSMACSLRLSTAPSRPDLKIQFIRSSFVGSISPCMD
jgi:hypothetical protein